MRGSLIGKVMALALLAVSACGDDEVSDEDLIEKFIEDVTGKVDDAYVARALGYVDLARFPLDVRVPRNAGVYQKDQEAELFGQYRSGMRRFFYDTELKLRSDRYEITGDSAEVKLGLMTAVGPLGADITLRKAGPGSWKVARVHVDR